MGWHETELILNRLAAAVRERQAGSAVVESIPQMVVANVLDDEKRHMEVRASDITVAYPL